MGWTSRFPKSTAPLAWRRFILDIDSTADDFGPHSKILVCCMLRELWAGVIVASKRNASSAWRQSRLCELLAHV